MLYLIRGIPGSGKSSYASTLILTEQADVHLEADMYHMKKGVYQFDTNAIYDAHAWCRQTTNIFLNNKLNVVVSNTFTRKKELQPYLDMAKELDIQALVCRCTGNYKNIHNVPADVMIKMKSRFEDIEGEIYV